MVVLETLFGNTNRVGTSIAEGIRDAQPNATVDCVPVDRAGRDVECDLLVVGGPTHFLGMSSGRSRGLRHYIAHEREPGRRWMRWPRAEGIGVREWLDSLPTASPPGLAAVFDTRASTVLRGAAASGMARRLRGRGYRIVTRPEGFLVDALTGPLRAGERARARAWGAALIQTLSDETSPADAHGQATGVPTPAPDADPSGSLRADDETDSDTWTNCEPVPRLGRHAEDLRPGLTSRLLPRLATTHRFVPVLPVVRRPAGVGRLVAERTGDP